MLELPTMQDVDLTNQRVLMREDFNVPIKNGVVQSDLRIRAALPGIQQALAANAQVILMSHLGRPEAGKYTNEFSLRPVAICLQELLQQPVTFIDNWQHVQLNAKDKLILLENVRFLVGETENSNVLAQQMANLCDVFVMDAFGSAHRAHASTVGVAEYVPAVAGPLLAAEIKALDQVMQNPRHPVIAIIGGAKVSTKLDVLQSLLPIVDVLIVGGGMANTLLAARGYSVGASLCERDLISNAQNLFKLAEQHKCQIALPTDCITNNGEQKNIDVLGDYDQIMDIGSETRQQFAQLISSAATILWNGPLGVFEDPRFAKGTEHIAKAIANSKAYSVVGGGDTLTVIDQLHLTKQFAYVSTGGGAFLEYVEGKPLPAIMALKRKRIKAC